MMKKLIAAAGLVSLTLAGCGTSPTAAHMAAPQAVAAAAAMAKTRAVPTATADQVRALVVTEMAKKTFDDAEHHVTGKPSVTATATAGQFQVKGTLAQNMLWGGTTHTPFTCTADLNAGTISSVKLAD